MSPPRLVIFDCDGVLVDSEPIASRLLAEALTELGFALTQRQVLDRYTGISMKSVLAKIEAEWGQALPADFAERMRERDYAAFRRELRPVPGVAEMLARLACPKCVASSGAPEKMALTLGVTGLMPHFAPHVFSATMVARGKPAPDLFLHAAREMGAAPADCVVIEDSVAGIRAALAAGMRPLGFAGGGHAGPGYAEMLEGAGARTVFADMRRLPELLG
jgi:HAD superfamily hydrolase (TIGR01509 family)